MRCLNCNTIVADNDPFCMSCGAQCTTTVREQQNSRGAAAGVACLILGVIFLAIAGYQAFQSYHIVSTYEHATGRLVSKAMVRTGRSKSCIGTIHFVAADGETYQAEIGGARSMPIGESVNVLYQRDNPSKNRADATSSLWGFPLAGGGIGGFLLLIWMCSPPMPRSRTSTANPPDIQPGTVSLRTALAVPGAVRPAPSPGILVDYQRPLAERSPLIRTFFGLVWVVGFVFGSVLIAALLATSGAGDNRELRRQLARQSGETIGPWVLLGSTTSAIVLACLGLLPGTGQKKR
jgi:hypothetical protein